jgi:hypothetical protein
MKETIKGHWAKMAETIFILILSGYKSIIFVLSMMTGSNYVKLNFSNS